MIYIKKILFGIIKTIFKNEVIFMGILEDLIKEQKIVANFVNVKMI